MPLPPPTTEIALLHLKSTPPTPPPSTATLLQEATATQAKYSSYPVHIFTRIEDPSFIYLVGGWASTRQHHEDWIPSRANRESMRQLAEALEVATVWMFHVEGDVVREAELLRGTAVVAVGRYFVDVARRERFGRVVGEMSGVLGVYTVPWTLFGDC